MGIKTDIAVSIIFALVLLVVSSCGTGIPDSSLTIREVTSNLLVATSNSQGVLRLQRGETRQIRVLRTHRSDTGLTRTDDVTQFTNFRFEYNEGGIALDQLGNIHGNFEGIAVLECKFRDDRFDPWDIVRLTIEVRPDFVR